MSSFITKTKVTPASIPNAAAGKINEYVDSTDGLTYSRDESGVVVPYSGAASLAAHVAAPDPHPQYETSAEAQAKVDAHANLTSNPHSVTKTQVGLSNVDNTSDVNKPISTATQTALNGKEPTVTAGTISQYYRGDKTFQTLDKAAVGLSNVDNTSDANKPISTATQTALNLKYDASNPNGYETPAQLNARDTANRARANHTGTQLKSTISDFAHTHPLSELTQSGATSGQVATWNGSAWVPQNVGGDTVLRVTATQSVATTTPTTVTALTTPSLAVGWYEMTSINIVQSTATGTGIGMRLAPVTATIGVISAKWRIGQGADGTDKDFEYLQNLTTTNVTSASALAANTDFSAQALGIFEVTVAGTVAIQLRSENGTSVSIRTGSILILKKVL